MIYTFKDALGACAEFAGDGYSSESERVSEAVNDSVNILMTEGHWKNTIRKMKMSVKHRILACPRNVETVIKIAIESQPGRVWSMGYEFLDGGPGIIAGINDYGQCQEIIDMGDGFPTFFPVGTTLRNILAISTSRTDIGKKIRVKGYGLNANEIDPTDEGEEIEISAYKRTEGRVLTPELRPSVNLYDDVTFVAKPKTDGYVTLYAYDPSQTEETFLWFLSKYHPDETQPGYRRYKIVAADYTNAQCLTALVKMRFVPLERPYDVLPIQHMPALKLMCKALHEQRHGDMTTGLTYQASAIRMLDKQLSNASPPSMNEYDVDYTTSLGAIPDIS